MGSPLGPVLANIFLGYCETMIAEHRWPELYRRFVDDTFSVFVGKDKALEFLDCLNGLHPALRFTMEGEVDMKLPFLDVLVMKDMKRFGTPFIARQRLQGCILGGTVFVHPEGK